MPVGVDPDIIPEAWDFALIGGEATPGLCKVSQGGRVFKWDKKPGFGSAGVTTKLTGIEPGTFTTTFMFYDGVTGDTATVQRDRWELVILPILKQAETGKTAIPFYHPAVSGPPMNISAAVPEHIGILEQDDAGVWSVVVKWSEFGKPKAASGTPKAAKTKGATAKSENEKQIEALTKELKELAG